ncbi:protein ITPRID1 isoform X2 [Mustelus asterias]
MFSVSVNPSVLSNLDKTERVNRTSMKEAWQVVDRSSPGAAGDDLPPILRKKNGDDKEQSIQEWLNMNCLLHANEHRPQSPQRTGIRRRMNSIEDDLMLGVEATLYPDGMQKMSVQEYMRTLYTCSEKQTLSRWNSVASATSVTSGPRSVVELLNLWHDDPEDLLLELGFGKEEADISTKIPARFINSSSVATGINLGVFLDAQKLRMEMESPNLYNRFQQLVVLQSSLFTEVTNQNLSPQLTTEEEQQLDTTEKCRIMLRKVSQSMKDSQSFIVCNEKPSGRDRRAAFQHAHQCIPEDSILAPLTVAQNEAENKAFDMSFEVNEGQVCISQEMTAKGRDGEFRLITSQAKKLKICTSDQPPDSFEMEEVQSFDEDSCPRTAANKIFLDMKRQNSCQSDSSGFLEEPYIPPQVLFYTDEASECHEHLSRNHGWHKHAMEEIETMKKSLHGFRNRLLDLEQDITEQQASVYNVLTEDERDYVKRLRILRQAVLQEVTEMEVQLEERARQLGEGMGMQFQSLVEEQSSLCSYIEALRQTGDASSGSWPCSSFSSTTPTPAPATTSQELDCDAGITLPVPSLPGLSPAPSASNKTDTKFNFEADEDAEVTAKKQTQKSEMLDFRAILENIKQSFKQLRSPSPDPTASINH